MPTRLLALDVMQQRPKCYTDRDLASHMIKGQTFQYTQVDSNSRAWTFQLPRKHPDNEADFDAEMNRRL